MNSAKANVPRRMIFFLSAFALMAGVGIYVFFRSGGFVFHRWLRIVGFEGIVEKGQSLAEKITEKLPDWFLYSLPNGLWAFAYALLISYIWAGRTSWLKYFWFASIPILVLGFEGLQGLGLSRGTFSLLDIIFGLSGISAGIYTTFQLKKG